LLLFVRKKSEQEQLTEFIIIIIKLIINIGSVKILNLYNANIRLTGLGLGSHLPQIPPTKIIIFRIFEIPFRALDGKTVGDSELWRNSNHIRSTKGFASGLCQPQTYSRGFGIKATANKG